MNEPYTRAWRRSRVSRPWTGGGTAVMEESKNQLLGLHESLAASDKEFGSTLM